MIQGERYEVVLTCVARSHYQAELRRGHGGERTVHRYEFTDAGGARYVYAGVWLHKVEEGRTFRFRATAKREEKRWRQWRLSRLVILEQIFERDLLAF